MTLELVLLMWVDGRWNNGGRKSEEYRERKSNIAERGIKMRSKRKIEMWKKGKRAGEKKKLKTENSKLKTQKLKMKNEK